MGESSQQEVIPQEEVENESVNISEMCIGWSSAMILPNNIVTGVTIVTTHAVSKEWYSQEDTNTYS